MNSGWLLALAAIGVTGYALTHDYEEKEPMESRKGARRSDGSRLLGVSTNPVLILEGVHCPAFSEKQAARASKHVRVPKGVSVKTLRQGMNVEREHANIGSCHSPTLAAKIAAAHLRERPDYYTQLARFEK